MIQIVGSEATTACEPCATKYGLFSHCVTAPGALECENCHWGDNSSRCTLPGTPIPTSTLTSHRRIFSQQQRMQWEKERVALYADKARLEQSKAALTKRVGLLQPVSTRLELAGQTTEASTIYDEGCDKVADFHEAIYIKDRTGRSCQHLIGESAGSPRPP